MRIYTSRFEEKKENRNIFRLGYYCIWFNKSLKYHQLYNLFSVLNNSVGRYSYPCTSTINIWCLCLTKNFQISVMTLRSFQVAMCNELATQCKPKHSQHVCLRNNVMVLHWADGGYLRVELLSIIDKLPSCNVIEQ